MQTTTEQQDLVLIGGGHSHLSVIQYFAMHPVEGLRITVISKDIHTPYSGMLPGLIAGHYNQQQCHIDLRKLCERTQTRLFQGTVNHIDFDSQLVYCNNRPPVRFDWLSINTGSQPALNSIEGADTVGIAVKPIDHFLTHWQKLQVSLAQRVKHSNTAVTITVVGGGAAGIEVLLCMQYRLQQTMATDADKIHFRLLSSSTELVPSHNASVRRRLTTLLQQRNVECLLGRRVIKADTHKLLLDNNTSLDVDEVVWTIHAGSPSWPTQTGLDCNNDGFITVNEFLQSSSHNQVFAAGDIAHFQTKPLPKSGVHAVRAGKILAQNLHRAINNKALKRYRPQQHFLSLLMTGDKQAVASRGRIGFQAAWLWRWKDNIDRQFVEKFSPSANMTTTNNSGGKSPDHHINMRCGGCGAKIGDDILKRVMKQLKPINHDNIIIGLTAPDDAAVIEPPAGKHWLQTVDYFRAFINDPYLLGRIATNHCLSDIYAMGGTPHSALAIATVPYGETAIVEDSLLQLMRGAVDSLNDQGVALIGGHSSEGAELGFGLSVNGFVNPELLLTKGSLQHGQCLILTKALGTGSLFAANMAGQAQGAWIDNALQQMLIDNQQAAAIFQQHNASACTDITGFGILGHCVEMLTAGHCGADLSIDTLPLLNGAQQTVEAGWLSSLHPENLRFNRAIINNQEVEQQPLYPLLFDPQTAGGLLAAVDEKQATSCLKTLWQAGLKDARIIATVNSHLGAGQIQIS